MLVFDQLKKDDSQLRFLAVVVASGLGVLFTGLWWVQVVSANYYQDKLESQSVRSVRLPALRGNILDRDGRPLAESRPSYNIDLYLGDLSPKFQAAYSAAKGLALTNLAKLKTAEKKKLAPQTSWWLPKWWSERQLDKKLNQQFPFTVSNREAIAQQTRFAVSSNIVADLGARLQQTIPFDPKTFRRSYDQARALPMPILANLNPQQVARFEEQSMHTPGMDLDVQSLRHYPSGTLAAHVLGYLIRSTESNEGEPASFDYRLDDFVGVSGVERLFEKELRGTAGGKAVLVNYQGYRKRESVWSPAEPGQNVTLTLDLDIQKAAETALHQAVANVRGAVIVMDANSGDVLALASAPVFDPNFFVERHDAAEWAEQKEYLNNTNARPEVNRALYENYAPGSIFKIVVGLAALEQGVLDPKAIYDSPGRYPLPGLREGIGDTAGAGPFDFDKALAKSSNCYFIYQGTKPGVLGKVIALGQRLHLGERTGLFPRGMEAAGLFPSLQDTNRGWHLYDTAYLSFGQGRIAVTPLQMAVMVSSVANGGTVYYPRLVSHIEAYGTTEPSQTFPKGRIRDTLGVSQANLKIVHDAMKADVDRPSPDGTGHAAAVPGLEIAGKTGTAQVQKNGRIDTSAQITWFVSFAPVGSGRYAVVAMVESGGSGGGTCAPIAHAVYLAIQQREKERERQGDAKAESLARMR